jgi:signal transduction histidine kinase
MWKAPIGRIVFRVSIDQATTPTLARLRQTRAQQEALRRWLPFLLPVLIILVVSSGLHERPAPGLAGRGLVVAIGLGGFVLGLVGARGTFRRPGGVHVAFAVVLIASSVALICAQPNGPGAAGVLVGVLFVARRLPARAGVALSLVAFVVLAVITGITGKGPGLVLLALLGGFVGMAFLANRLAEANEQAEALLVELEQSRATEARAAGLAERQRLAREMHDVLAHSLSGLTLQLEGARMLAAGDPGDPRLPEIIDRAHRLAKTGLEEARRAIGMLRDDELPGPELLAELAQQFQADRGVPCRYTVSGEEHRLSSEARLALYRVAQEALTNITKHARPERVELHLAYERDGTRLSVEDFTTTNGVRPSPTVDSGYGLTGMRERAELLGGTLTTETTCSGFRVELDVPA